MSTRGPLSSQLIRQLVRVGQLIDTRGPFAEERMQPATADLTLADWGYCVKATFLPNPFETVEDAVKRYALYPVDLATPQVLNANSTYVFRLNERFELAPDLFAYFSPKSSIGRVNLWVRTLADRVSRFDRVPPGYAGPLYVMVTPKSWPVIVEAGLAINQVRLFSTQQETLSKLELQLLHEELGLMYTPEGKKVENPDFLEDGILLTADISGPVVAYRAKHALEILDLTKEGVHDSADFFDTLRLERHREIVLKQNEFYILATYEAFRVPTDYCVEMVPYDVASGEFRSHYAGFFDPGFGFGDGTVLGKQATLEIIPHETVILRHRQPVCKMVFERLVSRPDKVYGLGEIGSHYHRQQGPTMSKFFFTPGQTPMQQTPLADKGETVTELVDLAIAKQDDQPAQVQPDSQGDERW